MELSVYRQILLAIAGILFLASLMPGRKISWDDTITPGDSIRQRYAQPVSQWPKPNIDKNIIYQEMAAMPRDSAWQLVERDAKVKLGQLLFFDPRLSSSDLISCSTCHDPQRAWGDSRRISSGHNDLQGTRNSPSLLNVAEQKTFFWDGRSGSLEDQAISPISTTHEMNMNTPLLADKIAGIKGYKPYFMKAYGDAHITFDRILEAIATFERIIKSEQSPFDKFVQGDYEALTDQQIRGLDLFRGKARCMNCHHGTYLKDDRYHNTGLSLFGKPLQDLGRYDATRDPQDAGKFRTPSLRDVMITGPWMHHGLFDDMYDIVNHYNRGARDNKADMKNDSLYPKADATLQPLHLTEQEKQDIIAFLKSITATPHHMARPVLP